MPQHSVDDIDESLKSLLDSGAADAHEEDQGEAAMLDTLKRLAGYCGAYMKSLTVDGSFTREEAMELVHEYHGTFWERVYG